MFNGILELTLFAGFCILIALFFVLHGYIKLKRDIRLHVCYNQVLEREAKIEHTYYSLLYAHKLDNYPSIKKYLLQSKHMLDRGIPAFSEAKLSKYSVADKSFINLLKELDSAPNDVLIAAADQAKILSDIIEARNPILSKLNSAKKNISVRILFFLLRILTYLQKALEFLPIKEIEAKEIILEQASTIQSKMCGDNC